MKTKVYKLLFVIACLLSSFLPNGTMTMLANNSLTMRGDTLVSDLSTITTPTFVNGQVGLMGWLASSIKYPVVAEENGIQGDVICTFVVEKDGSITDVRVLYGIHPSLDKEAVRVLTNMPKWTPGYDKNGKPVRVKYTVPVRFRLQ